MGKLIEELCVVNANPAQHHGAKFNPDHIDIRPRVTFDPLLETGATGATCRSERFTVLQLSESQTDATGAQTGSEPKHVGQKPIRRSCHARREPRWIPVAGGSLVADCVPRNIDGYSLRTDNRHDGRRVRLR